MACTAVALGLALTSCLRGVADPIGLPRPTRPGEIDILVTMESQLPGGMGRLDREDIDSVVGWLVGSLYRRRPDLVAPLIGEQGTQVAAFGVRAYYVGYDNSERMVLALESGLIASQPECLGVVNAPGDEPDHTLFVFSGLDFPWQEFPMGGARGSETGFMFHLLEGEWSLVLISPLSLSISGEAIGDMAPCPDIGSG